MRKFLLDFSDKKEGHILIAASRRRYFVKIIFCAVIAPLFLVAGPSSTAQNIFVSAQGNIIKIPPSGTAGTIASGLGNPTQLAFNSAGNLFVIISDGTVCEYTPGGRQTACFSGLNSAQSLAFDNSGNLYVGQSNGEIVEIATNGAQSFLPNNYGDVAGLAFDGKGDLFVANRHGDSVTEIDTSGSTSTVATGLNGPTSLVLDSAGNVFVGNASGEIIEIRTNGQQSVFATGLDGIAGLAFDAAGNLFEADENSGNIYKFAPDGTQTTFASGPNYGGLAIQFLPELQAIRTNGNFQVNVSMPSPYYSTVLQASADLVNWQNVFTNASPYTFVDGASSQLSSRFFRATAGP